ncbi:hypothetical protein SCHPADRAFT_947862 [Schizopora paradoxa]|uniref:F-box domain-containing protein n=1 Tax=Schizopora paradoxa TaxID=27342 RepID=A0A0H2R421_9AGAM|nr:hypothetical protein SCHPADRAFT_947862 [Schizopora paradoxa]
MASVVNLPNEIVCSIFSLAIRNWRIFPEIFKTGNDFEDCVALIDLSRVCRRWGEISLTDPTLWSSLNMLLYNPSKETLRQAAHFANICFARSKNLPLACAIQILHLDDLRFGHPLMLALVAHEDRWSRIAIDITRPHFPKLDSPGVYSPNPMEDSSGMFGVRLKTAGNENLKEFHFNIGSWFVYWMRDPLPSLETLKVAAYTSSSPNGAEYTLAAWLPLAPNLVELEITTDHSRFKFNTVRGETEIRGRATSFNNPFILLPKLHTLFVAPQLLSILTCPALEKYVTRSIPGANLHSSRFRSFVERSAPPLHTLEIKDGSSWRNIYFNIVTIRKYLIPSITNLIVNDPEAGFFTLLSKASAEGTTASVDVLPALKHLEICDCNDKYLYWLLALIAFRWDLAASNRSHKSVTLRRCFESIPEALFNPGGASIELADAEERWRTLARCVNEGLILSR